MEEIENIELGIYRRQINEDIKNLVEKYRTIFGGDVPDIDQQRADKLILDAMQESLEIVRKYLAA